MENTQVQPTTSYDHIIEKLWASFDEIKEMQKEIVAMQKEKSLYMQETERRINQIEINLEASSMQFGDFENSFGDISEHMTASNLLEKFQELGYDFEEASNNIKIYNMKGEIKLIIDAYLCNKDISMLIDITTDLTVSVINDHVSLLEKMRKYVDSKPLNWRGDKHRFMGAVAGIVVNDNARKYASEQGFYLIEPSGKNFNITPPLDKPKEW